MERKALKNNMLKALCVAGFALAVASPLVGCKKVNEEKTEVSESAGAQANAKPAKTGPDKPEDARTPTVASDLERFTEGIEGKGKGTKLYAKIRTTMGEFNCQLYDKRSPLTVANFVGLARGMKAWIDPKTNKPVVGKSLYEGSIFHRVIPDFMIQGGDPMGTGMGNPGYQIKDEFHPELKHETGGLLSMANAGPNTGGSQFFVTEVPTPHLDNRHAIFGKCDNVALVKQIARVQTGPMDRPVKPVEIKQITFEYRE
jgi:cyclophilin family peptidyl-prolyl cis-trans isomerase